MYLSFSVRLVWRLYSKLYAKKIKLIEMILFGEQTFSISGETVACDGEKLEN